MDREATKTLINDVFGFTVEPTDDVTVSYEHSQKILKGGNKNSGNKGANTQTAPKQTVTPVKTQSPSAKPANTPAPTVKPVNTDTPLEDMDDGVINLD